MHRQQMAGVVSNAGRKSQAGGRREFRPLVTLSEVTVQHEMASGKTIGDCAIPHAIAFTILLISECTGETTYGHHLPEKQHVTKQKSRKNQSTIGYLIHLKKTSMLVPPAAPLLVLLPLLSI